MTDSETQSTQADATRPVERIRRGRIQAAIWRQTSDKGTFYNFTLERSYKDNAGQYQSTSSFSLQDALLVAKVADLVDGRIRQLMDADHATARTQAQYAEEIG